MKLGYLKMADIEKLHEIMKSRGIEEDRYFGTEKYTGHKTSIKKFEEPLTQLEVGTTIKATNELKL
jgi:hypothetical protein